MTATTASSQSGIDKVFAVLMAVFLVVLAGFAYIVVADPFAMTYDERRAADCDDLLRQSDEAGNDIAALRYLAQHEQEC